MLKMLLLLSCLCCSFAWSFECKENKEYNFLTTLKTISSFLPYNPKILVTKEQDENLIKQLANHFYKGNLIIFESDEETSFQLKANMQEIKNAFILNLSLNKNTAQNKVLNLDNWCSQNQVEPFDLIRLDSRENIWTTLRNSPETLKKVSVISIKMQNNHIKNNDLVTTLYLQKNLKNLDFILFPHNNQKKTTTELVFIRKDIYDCIFN